MRRTLTLLTLLLAVPFSSPKAATGGGAFLERSQDPAIIALGGASTALSLTPSMMYSNPAVLAKQKQSALQATGYTAFETHFYGFSYTTSFENIYMGIGYIGSETSGALKTGYSESLEKYTLTGDQFGAYQKAFFGSLAMSPLPHFYMGVSVKAISESIESSSAGGYGADVGVLWDIPILKVTLGAAVQNAIAPRLAWNQSDVRDYYRYYAVGISKTVSKTLTISADVHKKSGSDYTYHAGVEYKLSPYLPLRAGYNDGTLSLGTSLNLDSLTLSYAMVLPKSSESYLDQPSFFAVEYRFE